VIAWEQIEPLFRAAERPRLAVPPRRSSNSGDATPAVGEALVEASELGFRYRETGEPILQDCSLDIRCGDRLLLEGPSGSGKSTLAAVLAGLRQSQSGLVLLGGLDRQTLGAETWRRRIVTAPQFHENYVLSETLAFNLLMGLGWPPKAEDLEEADSICRELGLGELLERMPAGLFQRVGETGWQLSHGERSRLYIARALLQNADLIILDESFAALDPKNLRRCVACVLDRAPTVMVIAHP
jgi:ATP-binding cassette subfamily B protein